MAWLAALGTGAGAGATAGAAGGTLGSALGAVGGGATAAGATGLGSLLSKASTSPMVGGINALNQGVQQDRQQIAQGQQEYPSVGIPQLGKITTTNSLAGGIPGSSQNPNPMQQAIIAWLRKQGEMNG